MVNFSNRYLEIMGIKPDEEMDERKGVIHFPLNEIFTFPLEERDRKYLKRRFVGLCGKEGYHTLESITQAFILLPSHTKSNGELVQLRDACLSRGIVPYDEKRNLTFTLINNGEHSGKYRVALEKRLIDY